MWLQGQVPYPTISPTKKIIVLDLKIMVLYKVKHWDSKFIYRFWRSFQGPGTLRSPILMLRVARPAQAQLNLMLEAREAMVFHWQLFRAGTVFFIILPTPSKCIFHHLPICFDALIELQGHALACPNPCHRSAKEKDGMHLSLTFCLVMFGHILKNDIRKTIALTATKEVFSSLTNVDGSGDYGEGWGLCLRYSSALRKDSRAERFREFPWPWWMSWMSWMCYHLNLLWSAHFVSQPAILEVTSHDVRWLYIARINVNQYDV